VQISKLQTEIDKESENRAELAQRAQAAGEKKMKSLIETKMEKSDQKLDSMTVLMLHYCAGLQHCLDQEELERLKQLEENRSGEDRDGERTHGSEEATGEGTSGSGERTHGSGEATGEGTSGSGEQACENVLEYTGSGEQTCGSGEGSGGSGEQISGNVLEYTGSGEQTCGSGEQTYGNMLEYSSTDTAACASARVEGASSQDGELSTSTTMSAATMSADGTGRTELEDELLMRTATEAEMTIEVDEETAADDKIVSDDEVVMSARGQRQTEDETGLVESDMSDAVTSSAEQNVDMEEQEELWAETHQSVTHDMSSS